MKIVPNGVLLTNDEYEYYQQLQKRINKVEKLKSEIIERLVQNSQEIQATQKEFNKLEKNNEKLAEVLI